MRVALYNAVYRSIARAYEGRHVDERRRGDIKAGRRAGSVPSGVAAEARM